MPTRSPAGRSRETSPVPEPMTNDEKIPKVLVVDDEPNIRELVRVALTFHGCAVTTGATGDDALRLSATDQPDLIVLDVMLPDIDGFEVCRRLRASGNEVPVIFLTARDTTSDTVTGLALGGDDYITKPFSVEALVARVRAVLRRSRRRPGTRRGPLDGAPGGHPGRSVADRIPAARLPDAEPGPDAYPQAAARERLGLGVRRAVPGPRNLRELPAAQARTAGPAADPHPARRGLQPAPPVTNTTSASGSGTVTTGRRHRSLSLRARLLVGLIALTGTFLVVMGVVSSLVLGRLERNQFNAELRLAARAPMSQIVNATDGLAAAYLSPRSGAYGELTPSSTAAAELRDMLATLSGKPAIQVEAYLRSLAARDQPFTLKLSGMPALRVVWRPIAATARTTGSALPVGLNVILVGRPLSDNSSQARGLVLAELITGGVLLALLAGCGSWLIGRGLAPLDRMASTAHLITSSGDLTARMSDSDDRQETGRLAGAINTMLDRIQHAFGARLQSEQKVRQFAADASHELRTPLTTIRGYAELYRQGALGLSLIHI